MNDKDTLSLLHYKREKMALQHSQQIRNKIFEVKRKQFLRLKTIQELSAMLKDSNQFAEAFPPLLQLFEDEQQEAIDFGYLLFYWGVLDDLVEILKNFNKITEQQLSDLIKLIAFIVQSKDAIHYFINTKAPHILEYLLANHCNISIIENSLLILGNLENYKCNDYFRFTVIERLKQFLFTMEPLPVQSLIHLSFTIKTRDLPNQDELQRELIMLQNDDVLFEAIQYVEKLNIDQKLMRYLIESVDLITDPKQVRTKLLITLICDNMNKNNAIPELRDLLDKCLQSGKLLVLSCVFKLAQNYMLQSGYPYINQAIENKLLQLLQLFDDKREIGNVSIQKAMLQYLETLHIMFPETRLSNHFYEKILDTLQSSHLRLLSIVITRNKEFVRGLANIGPHKIRLQELAKKNDDAKELLKQIYL